MMEWRTYPDAMRHVCLARCDKVSVTENSYSTKTRNENSSYIVLEFLLGIKLHQTYSVIEARGSLLYSLKTNTELLTQHN
jgi:hypothetical protein